MASPKRAKTQNILKNSTTWLFIAPITDLVLTKEVGYEFTVDQVTFIDIKSFRHKRKKFGLPHRVSELEAQQHGVFGRFLVRVRPLPRCAEMASVRSARRSFSVS